MLNALAAVCAGSTIIIPSYMAKGSINGLITAQDVAPSGEFGVRPTTSNTSTNNLVKFTSLFLAPSSGNTAINNVALMTSITGGNLWANMLIPSLIQTSSFDVDVEIWVQINRG